MSFIVALETIPFPVAQFRCVDTKAIVAFAVAFISTVRALSFAIAHLLNRNALTQFLAREQIVTARAATVRLIAAITAVIVTIALLRDEEALARWHVRTSEFAATLNVAFGLIAITFVRAV